MHEFILYFLVHPFFIVEPPDPVCFHPSVSNLAASPSLANPPRLNLTWIVAEKPTSVGCPLIYCPKSKIFRVRIKVFDSIPYSDETLPNNITEWHKRRQPFHLFEDFVFSATKYYKFQVKSKRNEAKTYNGKWYTHILPRSYSNYLRIATSQLFYFGEQGELQEKKVAICHINFS